MRFRAADIAALVSGFTGPDITKTLGRIEASVRGMSAVDCVPCLETAGAGRDVLAAAVEMKRLAGQINVTIHALGILLCLPHLLGPDEEIEYVSLGAGNTGRRFDLETNLRVAGFKFIHWRGGPEAILQNSIFKDYFLLADHVTAKRKYLTCWELNIPPVPDALAPAAAASRARAAAWAEQPMIAPGISRNIHARMIAQPDG